MLPKSQGICRYLIVLVFLLIGCVQLVSADDIMTIIVNPAKMDEKYTPALVINHGVF